MRSPWMTLPLAPDPALGLRRCVAPVEGAWAALARGGVALAFDVTRGEDGVARAHPAVCARIGGDAATARAVDGGVARRLRVRRNALAVETGTCWLAPRGEALVGLHLMTRGEGAGRAYARAEDVEALWARGAVTLATRVVVRGVSWLARRGRW